MAMVAHPLVSVVMPFRDAAGTVIEAATSVLREGIVPIELVAIDDGSLDGGGRALAQLAEADDRLKLISAIPRRAEAAPSRGIVAALERGIAVASAPFIARMDADDLSLPGRLAAQLATLDRDHRLAAVGTQVEVFPDAVVDGGLRRYVAWQNSLATPAEHRRDLFVESPLCHPTVMMRHEALDAVGGYRDGPWPEDYDLWLRFDRAGYLLAKVPEVLYRWRRHRGQLTFSDPRYGRDRFRAAKAHYLAPRLLSDGRPLSIWGAGPTGKRLGRDLERYGLRARRFVDIDPRKIGRVARGAPIEPSDVLHRERDQVVIAVGADGARALIRHELARIGFREGRDYVAAA